MKKIKIKVKIKVINIKIVRKETKKVMKVKKWLKKVFKVKIIEINFIIKCKIEIIKIKVI